MLLRASAVTARLGAPREGRATTSTAPPAAKSFAPGHAPVSIVVTTAAHRGRAAVRGRRAGSTVVMIATAVSNADVAAAEQLTLDTIAGMKGRGQKATEEQKRQLVSALSVLEAHGGVPNPVQSPLIQGQWELLYTSKSAFDIRNPLGRRVDGSTPGLEAAIPAITSLFGDAAAKAVDASSSPIQRTVTALDAVDVSQNIELVGEAMDRVDQLVKFGGAGQLRLSAAASTSAANPARIDFTFDLAYFESPVLPFRIPYPVPFRLLGNEAKGWLDTTYLSERLRVSRGNKGTTFILKRRA